MREDGPRSADAAAASGCGVAGVTVRELLRQLKFVHPARSLVVTVSLQRHPGLRHVSSAPGDRRRAVPMFEEIEGTCFRRTPAVRFFDVSVPRSNATDYVVHTGAATSPPNDEDGSWQWYLHRYQDDHLLVVSGGRTFWLLNLAWDQPLHRLRLVREGTVLRIPRNTFHRSISDPAGSVVVNQAIRDPGFSFTKEFRIYNSGTIPRLRRLIARTDSSLLQPLS